MTLTTIKRALAGLILLAGCGAPSPSEAQPQDTSMRGNSLFAAQPDMQWQLPPRLAEISGLTYTSDHRLLGHDDEHAIIYEMDVETGEMAKSFALGDPAETGDFEGVAAAPNGHLYLVTSNGRVFRFQEGQDGAHVRFERFDTGLRDVCEIEGLAYDPSTDSLILACKTMHERPRRNQIALYAWSVSGGSPARPWLNVPLAAIEEAAGMDKFSPSAVEIDARSGRVIVLAARQQAMVELSREGAVLAARDLSRRHAQAEGVAIAPDGALVIADEAGDGGRAQLSRYPRAR